MCLRGYWQEHCFSKADSEGRDFKIEVSGGFVDIVAICGADGARRSKDRVARKQMAGVFAGVTRAGAASGAPTKAKRSRFLPLFVYAPMASAVRVGEKRIY
jgi:hypothetical protein